MRSRTIELIRNKGNLRKALGHNIEVFGIDPSIFELDNLHLLKSVPFDGHMTGVITMSWSLNKRDYPKLLEIIDEILMLIDNEITNG